MVLLKGYDEGGFTFYTNRTSRKASDLSQVPRASLLFPWYPIQRQVIIEGTVTALSTADSEPYFRSRPRGSQLGAWSSRQSAVISSRAELDDRYAALSERWPEGTRGADARVLGRIPGRAAGRRVLARPGRPDARPVPVPPGGRRLGLGAARAVAARRFAVRAFAVAE